MKIHFVCTANTFRSRLAEVYLLSKKIPDLDVSSSGIKANRNEDGPISWYGQRIIKKLNLVEFEKMQWTQTSAEILKAQDLVIFMKRWHFDQAKEIFDFKGNNFEIWDINDLTPQQAVEDTSIQITDEIFKSIKTQVEDLIKRGFKITPSKV